MKYEFSLVEERSQPVLSIKTTSAVHDLPKVIGHAYRMIIEYMDEIKEEPVDVPFVAYFNLDMQKLEIEIGIPVSKKFSGKGEIQFSEIPSGKYVSTIYKGSYSRIGEAYSAMMDWIEENNYEITGTAYEFYLNDPASTEEEELETKISFLMK